MKEFKAKIPRKYSSKLSKKNLKELHENNNTLEFYTDDQGIRQLIKEVETIEYQNVLKTKIRSIIKKHIITIIALIILSLLLINQSQSIKEIRFINYNTYDANVETFVKARLKKMGPFYYLNDHLNNINFDIKSEFYDYEWISVSKNGAYLDIDIKKQNVPDYQDQNDGRVGDYIAKKDAIIQLYYVKKGIVLVRESQSVEKGELLITGNLKYWIDKEEYIRPQGIVIGEVLEYHNIKVIKEETKTIRTGKIQTKNIISIFNKDFGNRSKFDNYQETERIVFDLFNFFQVKTKTYYHVEDVKNIYNYNDALLYAKSLIKKDFPDNDYEKIIFIELINYLEDRECFYFKFIVKKHENIAQFVPRTLTDE